MSAGIGHKGATFTVHNIDTNKSQKAHVHPHMAPIRPQIAAKPRSICNEYDHRNEHAVNELDENIYLV